MIDNVEHENLIVYILIIYFFFFKLMGVSECPYFFELVEEIKNSEQIKNINRNFRV